MQLPSLTDIEAAAAVVYREFAATPQYAWAMLADKLGTTCWVKHENHTPVGAFKIRGGLTYFDQLAQRGALPHEVISATRGNHGQSIGWAARAHGVACRIVVPQGNSVEKNAAMRALGVTLVEHGDDFQAAREHAMALAAQSGAHMVPSFHPDLLRGVATYWWELFKAVPQLDVVYVPIGQVTDTEVAQAMRDLFACTHNVAEGAGAASFAAAMQERHLLTGQTVGLTLCGGNVDSSVFARTLQGG